MSHFAVLVAANDEADLGRKLAPYQEYDGDEDFPKEYLAWKVEVPAGKFHERRSQIEQENPGLVAKYAGLSDTEVFKAYFGGSLGEDGSWGHWRNPQSKWDWWEVGGRWTGLLKLKDTPNARAHAKIGEPGTLTERCTDPTRADATLAGDVDWDGMLTERQNRAEHKWDFYRAEKAKWQSGEINEKQFRQNLTLEYGFMSKEEEQKLDSMSHEEYAQTCVDNGGLTFAFIDTNGVWHERAEMGWWAITSNDNPAYGREFREFVRNMPPEQMVYIVDAHI